VRVGDVSTQRPLTLDPLTLPSPPAGARVSRPPLPRGRERVGVRVGDVSTQRLDNALEHGIDVRQCLVVPEPQYAIALAPEKLGPRCVGSCLQCVLTTVELDHQIGFDGAEVHNEGPDRVLAPEPHAAEPSITES